MICQPERNLCREGHRTGNGLAALLQTVEAAEHNDDLFLAESLQRKGILWEDGLTLAEIGTQRNFLVVKLAV